MADAAEWTERYREVRPRYERLQSKLQDLLEELLESEGIEANIESRVKGVKSFQDKLKRKSYGDPLREMTDLVGLRIVGRTLDDIERIGALIKREFDVDEARSVDKSVVLDVDRFGYLSQHYIIRIQAPRTDLSEWKDFTDLCAEIQVRTILQHAWAAIQYPLDYKSAYDIPKQLRRRLFRLSALFELADEELDAISADAQRLFEDYKKQVESEEPDIELNVDSLRAYLETSDLVKWWTEYIDSLGPEVTGIIGEISRDVNMAHRVNITTLNEIDELLDNAKEWGQDYLREFFEHTFGSYGTRNIFVDLNGILTLLLIGTFPEVFTNEVLETELGFGQPWRATEPARKYNPRFREA